ncbi:MAG: DUF4340 domain-containing protein [Thermodesulfobacteriota bacterium]
MTPRRLLPLLAAFLVLAASFFILKWHQERQEQAQQQAKKIFPLKEGEITALTLKRGQEEIRLIKTGKDWEMVKPLKSRVDQVTISSVLSTLAFLDKVRDLGEEKDLANFGLAQPALVVEFTAQGQVHRLALGAKTPGDQGYYVQKDQDPRVLVISAANQASLDRTVSAFRDKALFDFPWGRVTALKIKTASASVDLKKTGPGSWQWMGREDFKVRRDRLEALLRYLSLARLKDFVSDNPKEVRAYGLAPQPQAQITLGQDQKEESLYLGRQHNQDFYARLGASGPVVLVEANLMQKVQGSLDRLEDRRLWPGEIADVHKMVWGTPPMLWTAQKEKNVWKITGPEKQHLDRAPAQVEVALLRFQELEYARLEPAGAPPAKAGFSLILENGAGKVLFRLEELGPLVKDRVVVRLEHGPQAHKALISPAAFHQWQKDLTHLTSPGKER